MAKPKEGRPEEFYKSQIRHLKKENSQLRKRIHQLENLITEPELEVEEIKLPKCPKCNKHAIQEMEFVGRVFDVCQHCSYRSKIKKVLKRKRWRKY